MTAKRHYTCPWCGGEFDEAGEALPERMVCSPCANLYLMSHRTAIESWEKGNRSVCEWCDRAVDSRTATPYGSGYICEPCESHYGKRGPWPEDRDELRERRELQDWEDSRGSR